MLVNGFTGSSAMISIRTMMACSTSNRGSSSSSVAFVGPSPADGDPVYSDTVGLTSNTSRPAYRCPDGTGAGWSDATN